MKLLRKTLYVLAGLLVLIVSAIFIVLRYYEDEVAAYAISKAKEQLITRSEFGPVDLAFWETFPNASIRFSDVYIEETFDTKDTLLYAKKILLEFNLLDLFSSQYNISAVNMEGALCRLKVNEKGADNYHIWKTDQTDTSTFRLDINELQLAQTNVVYADQANDFFAWLYTAEAEAAGSFGSTLYEFTTEGDFTLNDISHSDTRYANGAPVKLKSVIKVNSEKEVLYIEEGDLLWADAQFAVTGVVDYSKETTYELRIAANDVDLADIKTSLPKPAQQTLSHYKAEGGFHLNATLKKAIAKAIEVNAHCTINNGELEHKESGVSLDDLQCELRYLLKDKAEILNIRNLQATMNSGYLQTSGTVKNLSEPEIDLQLSAQAGMYELKQFFGWDTLETCEGNLTMNAQMKGKLKYLQQDSTYNWNAIQTTGSATLSNGIFSAKHSNLEFRDVQLSAAFNNKDAVVHGLSGTVNGSDFSINGNISNLIPFITTPTERITLNANLNSSLLDFTNLVETNQSTSNNEEYKFQLPHRIDFRLNSKVKRFVFRKFEATQIEGVAQLRSKRLVVDPVAFKTADGNFSAQLVLEEAGADMYRMNCLADLQDINIQKLFTEFENFDQTFIQDKHLRGEAHATVQFRTMLSNTLDVQMDRVESMIDVTIDNGELIGLESLQGIADYLRSNKWSAPFVDEDKFAEKMKHVHFSKLENVIEIKNRVINIPQMDIRSSAMDISARGTHTFDNVIAYTIGFSLRDLLVKKQTEWTVADDGLGKKMFVSMTGTTENTSFAIDHDAAKANRQQQMQAEKQNVKALLKEEFGLFKKDNKIESYKEQVTTNGSITTIEWEGDTGTTRKETTTTPTAEQKEETTTSETKKKKVPKWLEEKK